MAAKKSKVVDPDKQRENIPVKPYKASGKSSTKTADKKAPAKKSSSASSANAAESKVVKPKTNSNESKVVKPKTNSNRTPGVLPRMGVKAEGRVGTGIRATEWAYKSAQRKANLRAKARKNPNGRIAKALAAKAAKSAKPAPKKSGNSRYK
jgi:hypothetical protein